MRESNPRERIVRPPSFHWTNRLYGRGGGNRTRMLELMRLPRSPSLPSATELGGPGGDRTLIPWVQATDPPVERRAHSGGTQVGSAYGYRTRSSALATRNAPPHPGRTQTGGAHRPGRHSRQLSKNPLLRAGGRQAIRTRTDELRRLGCSRYAMLSFGFPHDLSCETEPPRDLARFLLASGPKQKRPSRGLP